MKDAEDEAFDELAKRQGHWGGGYQAKKAMAADKFCDANCVWTDHHPDCNMAADKMQEPPSEWAGIKAILDEYGLQAIDFVADFKAALAQPAQEPVQEPHEYDWSMLEAAKESLREHMARIKELEAALAQQAQEPDALTIAYQSGYHDGKKAALAGPQREQNFCPRCGKRTNNIHTCTPPEEEYD